MLDIYPENKYVDLQVLSGKSVCNKYQKIKNVKW